MEIEGGHLIPGCEGPWEAICAGCGAHRDVGPGAVITPEMIDAIRECAAWREFTAHDSELEQQAEMANTAADHLESLLTPREDHESEA